ncbi:MAG: methyl-accepting chemotaxis protein [Desulfococcaceae bacterium]
MRLKDIPMRPRLIGLFLLAGLLPLAIVGFWSSKLASDSLMKKAYDQLEAVREIKKKQIEKYFAERRGDMGVLIETVETLRQNAFEKLAVVQELKRTRVEEYFRDCMTDVNMLSQNPLVSQSMKAFADAFTSENRKTGGQSWLSAEENFGPWLRSYAESYGYYDLLLINREGSVVYSTAKESDLGQNLVSGSLKKSPLAKCFARALKETVIQDYEPYEPSGNRHTAFIAGPVSENGEVAGVIALQLPIEPVNEILHLRKGLGRTGLSFLAGKTGEKISLRSDILASDGKKQPVGSETGGEYINEAMSGKSGENIYTDSSGKLIIVSYNPVNIAGLNWACISSIDLEEAIVPGAGEEEDDFYARYIRKYGYYDLFLIHPQGRVFYSVTHEADYNSNMVNGKFADSGLGKLVRNVMQTRQFGMADFEPYSPSRGEPAAFIAQPLVRGENLHFIVALQLSVSSINEIMQERSGMGKSGETYLVGPDHFMRSDSWLDPVFHTVKTSFGNPVKGRVDTVAVQEALSGRSDKKIITDYNGNPVLSAFAPVKPWDKDWAVMAEIDEEEVRMPIRDLRRDMIIAAGIIAFAVALCAILIARGISVPLIRGVEFAKEIAGGNLTARIDVHQKDEIGILTEAMRGMAARLREIVADVKQSADNVSSGSQQMSSSAEEMSASAEEMSQGVSEQAASAEQVSSSMEEMASNIRQNADNAQETEKIARKSSQHARESGTAVRETVNAMKTIAQKISIIEEISRQTDLLALNAAVEAARAGEYGKGFAVVASEIRKLAERSQKAANEINALSDSSVSIAEKAGEMLTQLVPDIEKTAELVQEISSACNEQDAGAGQVNKAIQQLDVVIQQNASASEEMASGSEELASTSEELSAQAEHLRATMSFFKVDDTGVKADFHSNKAPQQKTGLKTSSREIITDAMKNKESKKDGEKTAGSDRQAVSMEGEKSGSDNEFELY